MNWKLTIIFILSISQLFSQSDSNQRQFEVGLIAAPYKYAIMLHAHVGVNFCKSGRNWNNNIHLATTTQDFTVKGSGSLIHNTTLSVGKNYQLTKKWFYFSACPGAGIYYADWKNGGYVTRNYGLCIVPRLELGWNLKKANLAFGFYTMIGFGFYQKFENGESYHSNPSGFFDRFHGSSIGTPYLKLILK